ncbi:MAG: TRAP transporter large permease subunit [Proteobacteria bacterium]|nr:TRAP transporter large permease subunit [Pseudomonadota bacterium]
MIPAAVFPFGGAHRPREKRQTEKERSHENNRRIYRLAYSFMGHRRGGLALATIAGCSFFRSICISSPATAATFGRVALPEMLRRKEKKTC